MNEVIKSGKIILDEFFNELKVNEELDKETVSTIIKLYEEKKLTDKNLTNALLDLREAQRRDNGKD